jgi:hypothetical protein
MKTLSIGLALLVLATTAMADHNDGRRSTGNNGAIAWSTRDRDGNKFSIVFQFGDRAGIDVRYEQGRDRYDRYDDRYGRYDRYDDRYDRDGRYDGRYGRNERIVRYCPPAYDYARWRGHDYDRRHFGSYDEWSDWRQWQKHWSKRRGWQHDARERQRAWDAFCREREHAYDNWSRNHRDDRRGRDRRRDD